VEQNAGRSPVELFPEFVADESIMPPTRSLRAAWLTKKRYILHIRQISAALTWARQTG
jgi:hypothetical protein